MHLFWNDYLKILSEHNGGAAARLKLALLRSCTRGVLTLEFDDIFKAYATYFEDKEVLRICESLLEQKADAPLQLSIQLRSSLNLNQKDSRYESDQDTPFAQYVSDPRVGLLQELFGATINNVLVHESGYHLALSETFKNLEN